MKVDTISIIIPIYNVEKYLARCLDSVLGQTYKNIEVILVNDGSKDGSLALCEAYAQKDARIKVIDKVNEGVSVARNTGMRAATGKYIGFVDPDDWLEREMYERLYEGISQSEYPIALCNYFRDTKMRSVPKVFEFEKNSLTAEEVVDKMITHMIGIEDITPKYTYIMGCVWRGLYEREFFETHELQFTPGITIMEDLVFMVQALLKSKGVYIDHGVYYHYIQNPKSVLHSYNERMWEDQIRVHYLLEESLKEAGLEEKMRNRLDLRYISMVFAAIKNETFVKTDQEFKDRVLNIKEICTDDKLKTVLERVKPITKTSTTMKEGRTKSKEKDNTKEKIKKVDVEKLKTKNEKNLKRLKRLEDTSGKRQTKVKKVRDKSKQGEELTTRLSLKLNERFKLGKTKEEPTSKKEKKTKHKVDKESLQ